MNPKTLNAINSGPSGGKTTIYAQAIKAHINEEPFFVPGFEFPPGRIAIVQTDRPRRNNRPLWTTLGLYNHPAIEWVNFFEHRELHKFCRPTESKKVVSQVEGLRDGVAGYLKNQDIGTVILDLYDPFQGGTNNRDAGYYSAANLMWAEDLNVAILGIAYCFKQTSAKKAARAQDRFGGFLQAQASMDWKYSIIEDKELDTPYWMIHYAPPSGEGEKSEVPLLRGKRTEGDPLGLFRPYLGPLVPSVDDIMSSEGLEYETAWRRRKVLLSDAISFGQEYK